MKLGEGSLYPDIEAVSTGSLTLDAALGIGGLPKGSGSRDIWPRIVRQNNNDFAGNS